YKNKNLNGNVGELLVEDGISLKIDSIDAKPGSIFTISYVSRLKSISELQKSLTVADQGKDTGILTLSLNGPDPVLIEKIIN
ncbi:tyrosine-protein kinase, partial [Klebsiella pneumoniae]|nr:tyrosine-protein kinase [Klebsiella pneumoniae]